MTTPHPLTQTRTAALHDAANACTSGFSLIVAVVVMAASTTDNAIGVRLLDKVVAHTPTVTKVWVGSGFKDDVATYGAVLGIDVEQVKRSDTATGFVPVNGDGWWNRPTAR
jgi:hypothetical protein